MDYYIIDIICSSISEISRSFIISFTKEPTDLPNILQGIGIAFLTMLIPIAIGIFSQKKEFEILDRNVVLDHIIKVKLFFLCFFLIFFPFLFWNSSGYYLRFIEILLWLIGVGFVSYTFADLYYWIKGYKFDFRFDYLKKLRHLKDSEESWYSVWKTKKINYQNEQQFFEVFSSKIDQSLSDNSKNFEIVAKLLSDFDNFIANRSIIFLTSEKVFPKILEWHFRIWEKEYEYLLKKEKRDEWSKYTELSGILDSVLRKIEERSLKERKSYSFFDDFKKHAERYKEKFIKNKDKDIKYYYIESLFTIFYQIFFENIGMSSEKYDIWGHYFPEEWKIKLENKENIILRVSLNKFLYWAQERIGRDKEEFDKDLENISCNLFPETDPNIWAKILIFVFSSYGENRVKSVISHPQNFGLTSRIRSCSGSISPENNEEDFHEKIWETIRSEEHIEKEKTFELACLIFKQQFSKENLDKYIESLKELGYSKESKEEKRKLELLDIFNGMLEFLNQQNKNLK